MDNKPRKKVAIIAQNMAGGGAERFASNLSLFISKKWDVVNILYENIIVYPYGGRMININSPPASNIFDKFYKLISRVIKIKKIKNKENVDIAISIMEGPNIINILTSGRDKAIISTRSFRAVNKTTKDFYGLVNKLFMRFFYKRAHMIVPVSHGIADSLVKRFNVKKENVKVVYNPVNISSLEQLSKESIGVFDDVVKSPVIINVGRLTAAKGQRHLIRVFKKVKEEMSQARLIIVGEGDLKDNLLELSRSLGLRTWSIWHNDKISEEYDVYFIGFQKNPFRFMARADLFAFPSLWEGFPNVLVEAMACGVPVIASDCMSGPREILAPDTDFLYQTKEPEYALYGVLMPVCDNKENILDRELSPEEDLWAKVIIESLKDDGFKKRYVGLAKRRVLDFKIESIIKQWEGIIETMIKEH